MSFQMFPGRPGGFDPVCACRVDDMVVAAVISLQDPVGSGADDICTWIEVNCLNCQMHSSCIYVSMQDPADQKTIAVAGCLHR